MLEGLKRLEYRGYDSAGHRGDRRRAARGHQGGREDRGARAGAGQPRCRPAARRSRTRAGPPTARPTDVNAHPHTDCGGTLAVVHNGIIENAGALRTALTQRGHRFRSETDTEVLAHLIEELHGAGASLGDAVVGALLQVEGTYGIGVVSTREPDTIVAARRGSPLLVAIGIRGALRRVGCVGRAGPHPVGRVPGRRRDRHRAARRLPHPGPRAPSRRSRR